MAQKLFEYTFTALGSKNEIKLYSEDPAIAAKVSDEIIKECRRIEGKFSRYQSESIITKINNSAGNNPIKVDPETAGLLDYADACFNQSEGLFDITSGVLRKVWNFKKELIPSEESIQSVLPLIGWDTVVWQNHEIKLPTAGMEIDLGGIGKEYAVDRSYGVGIENGITHGFVNLGGDLRVFGPRVDGTPWSIGIQHPRKTNAAIAQVKLTSGALATSGDYERFIEVAGKRYCHILNPKTGWPVEGIQSVTVTTDTCLIAGTLTTIAMLFGQKKGRLFLEEQGVQFLMY